MNPVSVAIVIALLVLALIGMAVSWRRRGRGQQGIAIPPVPESLVPTDVRVTGMLAATTFAGRPLDRVVVDGLGFRARAMLTVTDRGVLVDRTGGAPFLMTGRAGTASWALDKGVERDGLTVLGWHLVGADGAPIPVESAFRLPPASKAALLAALPPTAPTETDQEAPYADQ